VKVKTDADEQTVFTVVEKKGDVLTNTVIVGGKVTVSEQKETKKGIDIVTTSNKGSRNE